MIFYNLPLIISKPVCIRTMSLKSIQGRYQTLFFIVLFLVIAGHLSAADLSLQNRVNSKGYRYFQIKTTPSEIVIDGRLTEPAWQASVFQNQFLQREPQFGQPPTEKTAVGILSNEEYLFIAVKCYDTDPSAIIANEMRRDAIVDNDDYFEFILDTFNDRRNGYYFIINPNGVKREGTVGNEGKAFNPDWDGIWKCSTQITPEGWFAELAIPWKTLRFDAQRDTIWGVNFARMIRRKNEHVYWQLIPLDAGRGGMFRISQAGYLKGISGVQASGNIDLEPYILGGVSKDPEQEDTFNQVDDIGLDATIAVTSNMNLKLTVNTDFAQVEADQELVNLTRFSLYYPEKRDFFLDGAEYFHFGSGRMGRGGLSGDQINLFYSRRIGIINRYKQPILGGVKLLGKTGSYQIGFLSMQTQTFQVTEDGSTIEYPGANYAVFRLKKDILERSSIGIMLLNKHILDSKYYNRSAGIDAIFPLTENLTLSGSVAATTGPGQVAFGLDQKNMAADLRFEYNSDLWTFNLSHLSIQQHFNAEMGFIPRNDIRLTSSEIEFAPRPLKQDNIRQYRYKLTYDYLTNQQNRMLESDLNLSFGIDFQSSARFSAQLGRQTEFIDDDWEIRDSIIIPKGTYEQWRSNLSFSSDPSRDISAEMGLRYEQYYDGRRFSVDPAVVFKNMFRFQADFNAEYNHVSLPAGKFDILVLGCRLYYFFSTKLYLKAYLQWNDDRKANNRERIALSNVLMRWTYQPGSDLYLVYNESRSFGPIGERLFNRTVVLKLTFFWRN